jgi:hypothetical protein
MTRIVFSLVLLFALNLTFAQGTGVLIVTVKDKNTQEPLIGATVELPSLNLGSGTDLDGKARLDGIPVGNHNIVFSYLGYKTLTRFNQVFTSGNAVLLTIEMEEDVSTLKEVNVTTTRRNATNVADIITPLSIQSLTTDEIKSNPGGNFDVSRVIQVLPGVGSTSGSVGGFRNDIIIRGGAPNENVYYLDGIEIPVINHFATQGSAGGPTGILNVSFLEDVRLTSSAFDARFDNALASVFEFKQRTGNPERLQGNVRLSGTELALTGEGPLGKNTTLLASARRSYLQLLFSALDLPIRPNYWDFQLKLTHKIDAKTTLNVIGVGAIDEFRFGTPRNTTLEKEYVLSSNPSINQWNYTNGVSLKRLVKNGFWQVALSRSMFDNKIDRFENKQEGVEELRILGLQSQEIENKLRFDMNKYYNGWKLSYGGVVQYVKANTNLFNRIRKEIRDENNNILQPQIAIRYNSQIDFFRYGAFIQTSKAFLDERLGIALGVRSDMNSFTDDGNNPLESLSPRVSVSYAFLPNLRFNASAGDYYKLPIYTVLGFRDENGAFVNRANRYIRSTHYTAGWEYLPSKTWRVTVEGFYKDYSRYPVAVRDGISLANQGGDFGSIGNELVVSTGEGVAYGAEFFLQKKFNGRTYGVLSYTFVRSEFSGVDERLIPSAWDSRHLVSALFGLKLNKGWEIGLKYRYAGGAPFTPFDEAASQLNYGVFGVGILDFAQLNSQRLPAFSQLDIRIDKKWNFSKWTLDLYLDVSNVLAQANPAFPQYTFARNEDNSGFATTNGLPLAPDGSNAIPVILSNNDALVLPTIGFIVEW